jgi:hypothetical protein
MVSLMDLVKENQKGSVAVVSLMDLVKEHLMEQSME